MVYGIGMLKTGHVYRSPRYYEVIDALPEQDTHDFSFFEKLIHPCDYQYVIQSINDHRADASVFIL